MKEQRISQVLEEIAEQGVAAGTDLWPALRARLQSRQRPVSRRARMPAVLLGRVSLALAVLLVLGTVAFNMVYLANRLLQQEAGRLHFEGPQRLGLRQTRDGVTVVLEHGYADDEQIVLGLVISSTGIQRYVPYQITLTSALGAILPPRAVQCIAARPDLHCHTLLWEEEEYRFTFDSPVTDSISLTEKVLSFRLAVRLAGSAAPAQLLAVSLSGPTVVLPDTWPGPLAPPESRELLEPVVFDFSVHLAADQSSGAP